MVNRAKLEGLTDKMLSTGMAAQSAAMEALVNAVERAVEDSDDQERVVALAGAIAFTQFKLEATLRSITTVYPKYGELIEGIRETAHEVFGDDYNNHTMDLARKFNIYPEHGTTAQ
jgi:hypothetical protein